MVRRVVRSTTSCVGTEAGCAGGVTTGGKGEGEGRVLVDAAGDGMEGMRRGIHGGGGGHGK